MIKALIRMIMLKGLAAHRNMLLHFSPLCVVRIPAKCAVRLMLNKANRQLEKEVDCKDLETVARSYSDGHSDEIARKCAYLQFC